MTVYKILDRRYMETHTIEADFSDSSSSISLDNLSTNKTVFDFPYGIVEAIHKLLGKSEGMIVTASYKGDDEVDFFINNQYVNLRV